MTKLLNVQDHIDFLKNLQAEQLINMTTDTDNELVKKLKNEFIPFVEGMIIKEANQRDYFLSLHTEQGKFFAHYCQYSIEQLTDRLAEYENFVEKNEISGK